MRNTVDERQWWSDNYLVTSSKSIKLATRMVLPHGCVTYVPENCFHVLWNPKATLYPVFLPHSHEVILEVVVVHRGPRRLKPIRSHVPEYSAEILVRWAGFEPAASSKMIQIYSLVESTVSPANARGKLPFRTAS